MPSGLTNECKVLIIGKAGSGKSALMLAFCENDYTDTYDATVGIGFGAKEEKEIKFQIWDTAGEKDYRSITSSSYKNTQAILICISMEKLWDDEKSAELSEGLNQISNHYDGRQIYLVGTKSDLLQGKNDKEAIITSYKNAADRNNLHFIPISAKDHVKKNDNNINELFAHIKQNLPISNITTTHTGNDNRENIDSILKRALAGINEYQTKLNSSLGFWSKTFKLRECGLIRSKVYHTVLSDQSSTQETQQKKVLALLALLSSIKGPTLKKTVTEKIFGTNKVNDENRQSIINQLNNWLKNNASFEDKSTHQETVIKRIAEFANNKPADVHIIEDLWKSKKSTPQPSEYYLARTHR